MVFETVEILVPLAAHLAAIWLLLLHADGTRIGYRGKRVHDGEGTVVVLFQLLVLMAVLHWCQQDILEEWEGRVVVVTYLLVILETVLVLVCLLAANDWTLERLDFFRERELRDIGSIEKCLFPQSPRQLGLVTVAKLVVLECCLELLLAETGTLLTEQALSWLVDGAVEAGHAGGKSVVTKVHVHTWNTHHRLVEGADKIHVKLGGSARMRRLWRG